MSYWSVSDSVKIGEEKVAIRAENGLNFTIGQSSRRIQFEIPDSVAFFSGKDSYLEFDVKINAPDDLHTRLQWDQGGMGMMIQNLRLYDRSRGKILEEINDYNQIVALHSDYNTDDSLRNTRSIKEGGSVYSPITGGAVYGNTKSQMADLNTNPWFKKSVSATNSTLYRTNLVGNSFHACVPIHSGIFSGKVYPNMLTGCYIEIDCIRAPMVIRQLDSVVQNRRRSINPVIWGADVLAASVNKELPWAPGADDVTEIYLDAYGGIDSVAKCPFVVGEVINFVPQNVVAGPVINLTTAGGGAIVGATIQEIDVADPGDGVNRVRIKINDGTGAGNPVRSAGPATITATTDGSMATNFAVISMSAQSPAAATDTNVSYTLENVNLVVHEIKMSPEYVKTMVSKARSGGSIEFDIHSVTNHKNAITSSERQAAVQIHANNHKAKSIIVVPADSTIYSNSQLLSSVNTYVETQDTQDVVLRSARPGVSGIADGLSQYQFQIDGKLVPARPVDCRKTSSRASISPFHLYELEKALSNAEIPPKSFREFQRNFVIGRAMGVNKGVHDLRNKNITLNLEYSDVSNPPDKPKLLSCFVSHLRRIIIRDGNVEVVH